MSHSINDFFHLLSRRSSFQIGWEESLSGQEAMTLALRRAVEGISSVAPNPPVGCVLLSSEGRVLSFGHHRRAGLAHAEVDALQSLAGVGDFQRSHDEWDLSALNIEQLRGAHAFVTLEPCSHEGRTPSCAKTLARLPLAEVVYGIEDPNPKVAGRGVQILRDQGIRVRSWREFSENPSYSSRTPGAEIAGQDLDLERGLRQLIEIFKKNIQQQRSFVALKMATSLDGMMALENGKSQWITSEPARNFSMFLRGIYDAVLVGAQTVIGDNPQLNLRLPMHEGKSSKLVVLDPQGRTLIDPHFKIFQARAPQQIHVVTSPEFAGTGLPYKVHPCRSVDGVFDLKQVLEVLWKEGIGSIFVEGGAFTHSEFLRQSCVDRVWQFQAPLILGRGRSWTQTLQFNEISEVLRAKEVNTLALGPDSLITYLI